MYPYQCRELRICSSPTRHRDVEVEAFELIFRYPYYSLVLRYPQKMADIDMDLRALWPRGGISGPALDLRRRPCSPEYCTVDYTVAERVDRQRCRESFGYCAIFDAAVMCYWFVVSAVFNAFESSF